jgi:hypothetical protein
MKMVNSKIQFPIFIVALILVLLFSLKFVSTVYSAGADEDNIAPVVVEEKPPEMATEPDLSNLAEKPKPPPEAKGRFEPFVEFATEIVLDRSLMKKVEGEDEADEGRKNNEPFVPQGTPPGCTTIMSEGFASRVYHYNERGL